MKLSDEEKRLIKAMRSAYRGDFEALYWQKVEEANAYRREVVGLKNKLMKTERMVPPRDGDMCAPLPGSPHHPKCHIGIHERPLWFKDGRWRVKPIEGDVCEPHSMRHTPRIHHEACADIKHTDPRTFGDGAWHPIPT